MRWIAFLSVFILAASPHIERLPEVPPPVPPVPDDATPEVLRRIEVGERRRRIESGCTPESASRSAGAPDGWVGRGVRD